MIRRDQTKLPGLILMKLNETHVFIDGVQLQSLRIELAAFSDANALGKKYSIYEDGGGKGKKAK